MAKEVIMPALGMAQETGTLLNWHKREGETVNKGELLMTVATDKTDVDIEAPVAGILQGVTLQEGEEATVGQVIAWLLAPGEAIPTQTILLFGETEQASTDIEASRILDRVMATKQPQLIQGRQLTASTSPCRSWLAMPIESDRIWGAIIFGTIQPQHYSQEDLRIAHLLAMQLANAIRNAQRFAEINRLYAELEHTYTDLRRSEQLRDDMMRMVVHDLRNPLNVINMSLDLLDMKGQPEIDRLTDRAKRASRHMFNLINDLLDLGKLESDEFHLDLSLVDLTKLLPSLVDDWRVRATTEQKTILLQLPAELPKFYADLRLLRRVIDNLIGNAFKYTIRQGTITIGATVQDERIQLSIHDNGTGIPLDFQDRIFDKFVQVTDSDGKAARQGFGLGLAFCKLAIQAHGGQIWVESELHQGSTFFFTLPRTDAIGAR